MKIKQIPSAILAAIIGLIIGALINLVLSPILDVNDRLAVIIFLAFALVGIYAGIKINKTKSVYYKIFKPNKYNFFVSLILSVTLHLFLVIIYRNQAFLNIFNYEKIQNLALILPISILYTTVFLYPFSAISYFLYKNEKIIIKKTKIIIITLLILLNPFFLIWAGTIQVSKNYSNLYEPCGAKVIKINEDSVLKNSGITTNDIITGVDDIKINTQEDLVSFLNMMTSTKEIKIITKNNSFNVTPQFNKKEHKYRLGIIADTEMCKN